ncbi:MAG: phosphomannomutase/phosphoglucomutase [Candidatus Marsarchaeota archaeon]|jgi:phosphomannomutase/phosphoglucomutase|nr:phosphomannomutase/phosphoglucomutase [Candidatus Marsarchaeota archaeon]
MSIKKPPESVYRAYDIRGIYKRDIDEDSAESIGAAFARYIGAGKKVAFGYDVRNGSKAMGDRLLEAMSLNGLNVLNLGLVPTPVTYFAVMRYNLDGGIMVTASHNPKEWNGFKLFGAKGAVLGMGSGLEDIKKLIESESAPESTGGSVSNYSDQIMQDYSYFILNKSKQQRQEARQLRIGIDTGNGSYSIIAQKIMAAAGITAFAINNIYDPEFSGRGPEPKESTMGDLSRLVVEKSLDFGVAFDADGDRAVFVDDKGSVIRGDVSLALFIKNLAKPADKIVYEVSCSKIVEDIISEIGAVPVPSRIGRRFILENMVRENARLGGEISSHTYFAEMYNADDALFSTLSMYNIVARSGKSMSQLISAMPHYETAALEIPVQEKEKHSIVESAKVRAEKQGYKLILIDGVKVIDGSWRFIIRASNTSPAIRVLAESNTRHGLKTALEIAKSFLEYDGNQ